MGFVAWGPWDSERSSLGRGSKLIDVCTDDCVTLGIAASMTKSEGEAILGILRSATKPPPPGPKRLGGDRSVDQRLRDLKKGP